MCQKTQIKTFREGKSSTNEKECNKFLASLDESSVIVDVKTIVDGAGGLCYTVLYRPTVGVKKPEKQEPFILTRYFVIDSDHFPNSGKAAQDYMVHRFAGLESDICQDLINKKLIKHDIVREDIDGKSFMKLSVSLKVFKDGK